MIEYDIAIIGGGCVSCSVAKHLAEQSNLDICILRKGVPPQLDYVFLSRN